MVLTCALIFIIIATKQRRRHVWALAGVVESVSSSLRLDEAFPPHSSLVTLTIAFDVLLSMIVRQALFVVAFAGGGEFGVF